MTAPEPAGIWLRVSTGAQDEQNQEPEITAWCAQHGYEVVERYELSGKSAFHGNQQDALDEALTDVRTGRIRVLVTWTADRLERRGAEQTLKTFRLFREAGGRIESVKEPFLNTPGELLELLLPIVAWVARFEAQRRQDRAKADRAKARSAGSFTGRPPWGLEPVKLDHGRWTLVPGPEGRKYVPEMFARVIRGETLRAIAAWLAAETGRAWWPQVVRDMVTNPAYMGRQTDKAGIVIVECEALVDAATFARAGVALATRPKRGPAHRSMLGGVIFCPRCEDSPMYRVTSGKAGRTRIAYYRCWGRGQNGAGAAVTGCGATWPKLMADASAAAASSSESSVVLFRPPSRLTSAPACCAVAGGTDGRSFRAATQPGGSDNAAGAELAVRAAVLPQLAAGSATESSRRTRFMAADVHWPTTRTFDLMSHRNVLACCPGFRQSAPAAPRPAGVPVPGLPPERERAFRPRPAQPGKAGRAPGPRPAGHLAAGWPGKGAARPARRGRGLINSASRALL